MHRIARVVLRVGMLLCPLASIAAPADDMRTSDLPNVFDLISRLKNSTGATLQDEASKWQSLMRQWTQTSTNSDSAWRAIQNNANVPKLTNVPNASEKTVLARALLKRFEQLRKQGRLPKELLDQAVVDPDQMLAYFKQNAEALGDLKDLLHGVEGLDDLGLKREMNSLVAGGGLNAGREASIFADSNTDPNSYKNYESAMRSDPVKYEDVPVMSTGLSFSAPSETKSSKAVAMTAEPLPPVAQPAPALPQTQPIASAPVTVSAPAAAPLASGPRIASRSLASPSRSVSPMNSAEHSSASASPGAATHTAKTNSDDGKQTAKAEPDTKTEGEGEPDSPEVVLAEMDETIADLKASCESSGGNACTALDKAIKRREQYAASPSHGDAVPVAANRSASNAPKREVDPGALIDTSYFPPCPQGVKPMGDTELKAYIDELRRQNGGSITTLERLRDELNRAGSGRSYWSADKNISMGCVAALHRQQQAKYGLLNGKRDCGRLPNSPECKCERELNKLNLVSLWDRVSGAQAPNLASVSARLTGNDTRYQDACSNLVTGQGKFAPKEAEQELMAMSHMTRGSGLYYQLVLGLPSAACAALNPVQAYKDRNKDASYYPDGLDDQCRELSVDKPENFDHLTNLDRIQILSALRYAKSVASVANEYDPPKSCGGIPITGAAAQKSAAKTVYQKTIRLLRIVDTERETSIRDGREIALQDLTGREVRHPSSFVTATQMNGLYNNLMRCTKPGQLGWAFLQAEEELRALAKQCDPHGEASNFDAQGRAKFEKAACDLRKKTNMNLNIADSAQLLRARDKYQVINGCTEIRLRGGPAILQASDDWRTPLLFRGDEYCPDYPKLSFNEAKPDIVNAYLHIDRVRRNRVWQNFVGAKIIYGVPIDSPDYSASLSKPVPGGGRITKGLLKGAVFSSCGELIDTHRAMMYMTLNRMAFSDERLNQQCTKDGGVNVEGVPHRGFRASKR